MMFLKRIAGAAALTAALLGSSLIASPAQAGYIVKLQQLGTDVIATGIGILDLTGLSPIYEDKTNSIIWPMKGSIATGPAASPATFFLGIGEIRPFGRSYLTTADTGTGNIVGVFGDQGILIVPQGYASGTPLVDTATYLNETFDKLGVIPGTYVSKWGAGPNQNFKLIIGFVVGNPGPGGPPGPVTVPEPASAALLATALAGLLLTGTIRRARSDA